MTTRTSKMSGERLHGLEPTAEKSSSPRSRFPHDGSGSITPRPSMLSVASVRTNIGIEIQNCAVNTGLRFGRKWYQIIFQRVQPLARASSRKSELRKFREAAQTTRREVCQPKAPKRANV